MKSNFYKFKEKFFHSSPIFKQLVAMVKQTNVESVIRRADADKYSKRFKIKDKLYTMLIN
jgi:hypothetical protein